MIKKWLTWTIVLCLVFGLGLKGWTAGKTTISWWVPNWDEPVVRELVAEFEEKNPDIAVKIVITTWDTMANKILLALMSGNTPDLITELESRIKLYAARGLLTNLDPYYAKDLNQDDFISSALELNSYNGSIYGMPFRHDGSGMLYNKDMFRKAGLDPDEFPKTWQEYLEVANKLTIDTDQDGRIDQYGLAWPLGNQANATTRYIQLLYSFGGDILSEDGSRCLLDSEQAIKAMQQLRDTIVKSKVAPRSSMELDNTTLRGLFINQKIAMYVGGQFDIAPIQKEAPDIDLGTAVIPGPGGMGTTTVNGFSLILPQEAKHPEEAWRLIKFVAEPENMARLTDTFPGRKSALELAKFNQELLKPFARQLEKGKSEPSFNDWPEMEKVLYYYLQKVILDEMDVEQAMKSVTVEINKILKN